jgi:aspartate aminotransferase-like enzyme
MTTPPLLMIPGPTPVAADVLAALEEAARIIDSAAVVLGARA